MVSRSKLVLFDTGIIIQSFRLGVWDALVSHYHIITSEIVVEEAKFFMDENNIRHPIELLPYVASKAIQVEDVSLSELKVFKNTHDPVYFERLDPGELSLLCLLFKRGYEEALISSGDGIVYRILGKRRCSERGVSLEELAAKIGVNKKFPEQFRKKFKEDYSRRGFDDSFC